MRLLLDEQLSAVIAHALRQQGHDVIAVQEPDRVSWRGVNDAELFQIAQREGRAVVTDNVAHFRVLAQRWLDAGRSHFGVLYLNNTSLPRHRHDLFVSNAVQRLDELLRRYADHAARSTEEFV